MDESRSTVAQQVAQVAIAFEQERTGHAPESVAVVLGGDTLVVTLRGALSPAERALARSPAGAARVQEFHRQLFASSSAALRQEIRRITGVAVREAVAEIETTTGTVVHAFTTGTTVQVFLLASSVPAGNWNGSQSAKETTTMTTPVRTHHQDDGQAEARSGDRPAARTVDQQALIEGLNHDLAGEYQAILMYTHYSAKLTGPYRRELRALFQAEIGDEQGHAQFLADKIAALGGEPTTAPGPVPHADQPREMLLHALAAEEQAVADYNERIRQAEGFGDLGLKADLENQVADETRHKEEIERILSGWGELKLERAQNVDRWQDDGGQG
jgi:bacterioferritin